MEASEILSEITQRLRADGQDVATTDLQGGKALIGYRADFRLQWMATRLHLFTACIASPAVTGIDFEHYVRDVLDYGVQRNGRARGLQSGVAAIPIVLSDDVDKSAVYFARSNIIRRWSAFAWPAVLDTRTGTAHRHEGTVLLGGVYASWMRKQTSVALGS